MEIVLSSFVAAALFITELFGGGAPLVTALPSVELGLREVSPEGTAGGFAIPASGCSTPHPGGIWHDCAERKPVINVDKPIVRLGDPVVVSWDPKDGINCTLSQTVTLLTGGVNPGTAPNANAVGSRTDTPTGETLYTISCDGTGNSDIATSKVLPRIQET